MEDTGFIFIPEHIMERDDLSLQEKCVFGRIIGLTKKEGYCYATNEWLGIKLGLSGSMVSKHISSLVKKGCIEVRVEKTKKGKGDPNEWGTRRKIYAFMPSDSSPYTINGEPPSTINGEYSIRDNSNTVIIEKFSKNENPNAGGASPASELEDIFLKRKERKAKKQAFGYNPKDYPPRQIFRNVIKKGVVDARNVK